MVINWPDSRRCASGITARAVTSMRNHDDQQWLRAYEPEVVFCLGSSEILGNDVLDMAPGRVIGFHQAALPRHRGRHPLIWTLALGLPEASSTCSVMDSGTDSGDIVNQQSVPVVYWDFASDVYA